MAVFRTPFTFLRNVNDMHANSACTTHHCCPVHNVETMTTTIILTKQQQLLYGQSLPYTCLFILFVPLLRVCVVFHRHWKPFSPCAQRRDDDVHINNNNYSKDNGYTFLFLFLVPQMCVSVFIHHHLNHCYPLSTAAETTTATTVLISSSWLPSAMFVPCHIYLYRNQRERTLVSCKRQRRVAYDK